MPVYNQHNFISDLKLGIVDISKLFIGNTQIYPNESLISGLAFTESNISNSSQSTPFVVTGTEDAEYTLSGSVGATAPSGTHVIPASGSNSHNISISAQSTGASARYPRVDLSTVSSNTPTSLSPPSLQTYDTVLQAAGPAPTYTHTTNYIGDSNCTAHTSTGGFASYSPTGATSRSYPLAAGASWFYDDIYIYPVAGKQFTSIDAVTVASKPSWVTVGTSYNDKSYSGGGAYYTYIRQRVYWTGQSSTQTGNIVFATNPTYTTNVDVTFTKLIQVSHSNYAGTASPLSIGYNHVTGIGTSSASFSTVVNDQGTGVRVGSVGFSPRGTSYGSDLISNGGISGLPAGHGDTITFTLNFSVPNYRRYRTTGTSSAITMVLYDE